MVTILVLKNNIPISVDQRIMAFGQINTLKLLIPSVENVTTGVTRLQRLICK
jgi:hypothetical protein